MNNPYSKQRHPLTGVARVDYMREFGAFDAKWYIRHCSSSADALPTTCACK